MLHLFRKKNLETTDVFRTQSKVYDATFMRNSLKPLFIFAKKTPSQMLDCVLNTPLETITKIINLLVLYQIYQVPLRNKNLNYVKTFPLVCSVFIIYKTFTRHEQICIMRLRFDICKNIFSCLFSVHNTISLSRHE